MLQAKLNLSFFVYLTYQHCDALSVYEYISFCKLRAVRQRSRGCSPEAQNRNLQVVDVVNRYEDEPSQIKVILYLCILRLPMQICFCIPIVWQRAAVQ